MNVPEQWRRSRKKLLTLADAIEKTAALYDATMPALRLLPTPRQRRERLGSGVFPPHYDITPVLDPILKGEPLEPAMAKVLMQGYERNMFGIPVSRKVP
jgi:hypothetical protein